LGICLGKLYTDLYRMLSSAEIEKLQHYFSSKPVNKAFLFGSVARNEEQPNSDIDLLVEIDANAKMGLVKFFSMQLDLEESFEKKVDLLEVGGVSKFLMPTIDREKKLVYEKRLGR
jgi:uncharacterized protein